MKKIIMILVLTFTFMIPVYADNNDIELREQYEYLIKYAESENIPLDISYEIFEEEYNNGNYRNSQEYLNNYYTLLKSNDDVDRSSGSGKWYYNTGTILPQIPKYSKYKLLGNLRAGDIIYEANGGFGITGHIAIVEGTYYYQGTKYIRLIEAIDDGVVRSVLDDERVDDKAVTVLRTSMSYGGIDSAINFCTSQLGKSYSLDFAHDTSYYEDDWYCSELVWASYKNQGLDIETNGWYNEPGITPRDILNCDKVSYINIEK